MLDTLMAMLERGSGATGLAVLAACAAIEYLFPPFPGDTVTLFGAFLAARRGFSAPAVLAAVVFGSAAGAMADFYFGRWLAARGSFWTGRRAPLRERIDRICASFARHGEVVIVLNRFVPGVRALIFVAAGMTNLRPGRVLLWATVSALLWNALLLAAGTAVGNSWEDLRALAGLYSRFAWAALALLVAAGLAHAAWRRFRRGS